MTQMIQHYKAPLLLYLLSSAYKTVSRMLIEMILTPRIVQSGLDYNTKFSQVFPKIISAPNQ